MRILICGLSALVFCIPAFAASPKVSDAPVASAPASPASAEQVEKQEEDAFILEKGEISNVRYGSGIALAVFPGFGVGHIVTKQFTRSGWIFLAGEAAGASIAAAGAISCLGDTLFDKDRKCKNDLYGVGAAVFVGFRVWEIVDAISRPRKHNKRYRELSADANNKSAVFLLPRTDSLGANLVYSF